ncbi:hypothetical protein ABS71_02415 [bacterium SCN 62-11]|nr:glycosyltransferase [Candidatus Eremiobacteraeota bacterium]ODT77746.1 MAG: hypothetical protein ABS71_02415 [bacterium SCN 62-11]
MAAPKVTIVVAPRERFSPAADCFEHLVSRTPQAVQWIYVDTGIPEDLRQRIQAAAPVEWITTARYASPNEARNAGLAAARGEYVIFLDNDVMVGSDWLEPLVRCADETGAWVVGPLYMIDDQVHMAGGKLCFEDTPDGRILREEHQHADCTLQELELSRQPCDYVEFHCMLIRRERIEPLREELLSLHEHLDLCLSVQARGGSIYLEPASQVTYLTPPPFDTADIPFFTLRWCEAWNRSSTLYFKARWQVVSIPTEEDDVDALVWARGHRRRLTGTSWRPINIPPEQHLAWIVAAFMAVDCHYFEVHLDGELEVRSGHELLSGSLPIQRLRPCAEAGGPRICPNAPEGSAFLTTSSGSWAAVLNGPAGDIPWIELGTEVESASLGRVLTTAQWPLRVA